MSGLTKNQHFVPRLLLKNFATGADGMVQVFDSTRQVARRSSVRGVLAQNFYYDDDNAIEKFLAEEIEAPAAPVISAIIADPGRVIPRRQPALTGFLMAQLARTPGMYAEALSFVDGFTKMLLEQYAELNGLARESVSTITVRPTDDRAFRSRLLLDAIGRHSLLEDLSWHVLRNGTSRPFVISDHPAVMYNWLLRDADDLASTSMTKQGVQVFLPLSPWITLALTDATVYKIGKKGDTSTMLHEERDVDLLNSLQFRSRQDCIVYPIEMDSDYVRGRCAAIPANSLSATRQARTAPTRGSDGLLHSHTGVWRTRIRLEQWLSVCKVKRRAGKRSSECLDRIRYWPPR